MSLVAKLLDPKDALTSYDDLLTDEFVRQCSDPNKAYPEFG